MSNDQIDIPDADGEPGVQHTPEDADGNDIPDNAEQMAGGAKYDTVHEAYKSKDGFLAGVGEVIKNTALGRNTAGRVTGIGLDILEIVFPLPVVSRIRRSAKKALNLNEDRNQMKDALKRAFTSDGGTMIRVRDEDGNISLVTAAAFVIRAVLFVGVLWLAQELGVLDTLIGILELA